MCMHVCMRAYVYSEGERRGVGGREGGSKGWRESERDVLCDPLYDDVTYVRWTECVQNGACVI